MNNIAKTLNNKTIALIIIWGLILEFPIRYFISPDPWIQNADHWYFMQPNRLLIEIGFVFLAFLPFLMVKELKALLSIKWTKKNILFLTLGIIIPVIIFTSQQWEEVVDIREHNLFQYIPIWFATGMVVGVGQELTFRGLIFTGFYQKHGLKWAVLISTLCFAFGAIHSPRMYAYFINGYISEALLLLFVFIITGLFFAWLRVRTKNIMIPALAHGIGNAITWATFVIVKLYV
jgi:membrane protease YdiL (CAAX protease family)